ncbi:hypothetical protein HMPREF9062_0827 [Actinomyces sp. oral taxon 448 str. F0400]|nr:hypothetical protein HMPREF9062_0827 [Actinomyces sp. oral taxon 448 str. F0400]
MGKTHKFSIMSRRVTLTDAPPVSVRTLAAPTSRRNTNNTIHNNHIRLGLLALATIPRKRATPTSQ